MNLTEQEKDIITRALESRKPVLKEIIHGLRNERAREKFKEEQRVIYALIEKLKEC